MRLIYRSLLAGVILLICPAKAWCDELNVAYFEELAAQTFLVEYRILKTEGNLTSIRSFAFDELQMRSARKNDMFITDMRAFKNGALHEEKQYRCNGESTFLLSKLGDGKDRPQLSSGNYTRVSSEALARYEYYGRYLGLRNPHMRDEDNLFQRLGLRRNEWWLDRQGAFSASSSRVTPQGVETIKGVACDVYQLKNDTLWIDQRDARRIMRHRVEWEPGVGKIDVTYSDYRDYGKFSFPWQMEWTFYCHASLEPALKGQVAYRTRLTVDSLQFGASVPDSIFSEIPLPPGTLVRNIDTGQTLTFGNAKLGQPNVKMLDELGFSLPERKTPWRTIAWIVGGGIAVVGLAMWLWRKRQS